MAWFLLSRAHTGTCQTNTYRLLCCRRCHPEQFRVLGSPAYLRWRSDRNEWHTERCRNHISWRWSSSREKGRRWGCCGVLDHGTRSGDDVRTRGLLQPAIKKYAEFRLRPPVKQKTKTNLCNFGSFYRRPFFISVCVQGNTWHFGKPLKIVKNHSSSRYFGARISRAALTVTRIPPKLTTHSSLRVGFWT